MLFSGLIFFTAILIYLSVLTFRFSLKFYRTREKIHLRNLGLIWFLPILFILYSPSSSVSKGEFKGCFESKTDYVEFFVDGTFLQTDLQGQKYNNGAWRVYEVNFQNQKNLGGVLYNFLSESVFSRDEHDVQVYKDWSGEIYFKLPSGYRDSPPTIYTQSSCVGKNN